MSALREAVVLPLVFLTVTLLAGLQIGPVVAFVPPSVFALVLGTMLLTALVRSGALAPARLLDGSRPVLANANGAVVLVTLLAAAAQVLGMLTPRTGPPALLRRRLSVRAAAEHAGRATGSRAPAPQPRGDPRIGDGAQVRDPRRRSPDHRGAATSRVLVALFDAATFGTVAQEPQANGAGYLAFFAIGLFLIGVSALPSARPFADAVRSMPPR